MCFFKGPSVGILGLFVTACVWPALSAGKRTAAAPRNKAVAATGRALSNSSVFGRGNVFTNHAKTDAGRTQQQAKTSVQNPQNNPDEPVYKTTCELGFFELYPELSAALIEISSKSKKEDRAVQALCKTVGAVNKTSHDVACHLAYDGKNMTLVKADSFYSTQFCQQAMRLIRKKRGKTYDHSGLDNAVHALCQNHPLSRNPAQFYRVYTGYENRENVCGSRGHYVGYHTV